ncbi:MAG: hypothetical protein J6C40_13240, partial [Lentisphaeria bacterium]|nr:hypothetical protein [Lentisphaeria bacterium]
MSVQRLHAHRGGIYGRGLHIFDNFRQRTGVVHFSMVGNDDVNFCDITDNGFNAGVHFLLEGSFDRVDQRDLIRQDKKSVVCGPAVSGVSVELFESPVNGTDPPDLFCDFYSVHF